MKYRHCFEVRNPTCRNAAFSDLPRGRRRGDLRGIFDVLPGRDQAAA